MAQTRTVDEWLRSRSSNKFGTEHIRNDSILSVGQSKKNTNGCDTRIENFHDEDRGISITGFFKYGNQYKELHEEHIRNDSILSVGQSKKNIYTDTRIENFHDEDRGISITGFFKYGNQYKELHEDTVISFPFYEITFDILL